MDKKILDIYFRYFLIFIFGLFDLKIFYIIFTPVTTFLVKNILSLFGDLSLFSQTFSYNNFQFVLSGPCIAGAAYYLLFILIMSCYGIKLKERLFMILSGFSMLLFFNVFRIIILANIYWNIYFNFLHLFFWYFMSVFFVVSIWFFICKIFKIKFFPIFSDFSYVKNKYIKNKKG
jgi:hypothetical protein